MGTRHLICVQHDQQYKVAQYGQWDGYPSGQGSDILNFLKTKLDKTLFISKLNLLFEPTDSQIKQWYIDVGNTRTDGFVDFEIAKRFGSKYPSLSRDTGSNILEIIHNSEEPIPTRKSLEFAADSLFCEWAYVIDLDLNTFEVFVGFNKSPLNQTERFSSIKSTDSADGYHPVRLVKSWSLSDLPSEEDFLALLEPEDE